MTTTFRKRFTMTGLAAALAAAYGGAYAQTATQPKGVDEDLARLVSPSADDYVSAGVGNWSNNRAFQGQYDGMREQGSYLLLDGSVRRRNDATGVWFSLNARNLGLDTRELRFGLERQGDMGGYLEFNQIPRKYPWTVNTNLVGIGQTDMTIRGTPRPPTSEATLGTVRDRADLGFYKNLDSLLPGLKFKVDYRTEEKNGYINYGLGSQPLFVADPIDSRIQLLDAHFEYSKDKLQMRGGYYGTWYDTSVTQLLVTRAGAPTTGPSVSTQNPNPTPLSQPLDNQSWEVYLDGGYSFTPGTRLSWKAKYGRWTQNEQFPSLSLTGVNAPIANMASSLNGKIDITQLQASLSSRPTSKLLISANLRYYDMDAKTPTIPTATSGATPTGFIYNTPQSITTTSGNVEAKYSLPYGFKLVGDISGKHQNRSVPQYPPLYVPYRDNSLDEWNYGIQLRRSLSETVNGSLGYVYSTRTGSSYTFINDPTAFAENQISPWHIADRNRSKIRGRVDWTPLDNFTVQAVVEEARDQYPHEAGRPYGMINGKGSLYSLDATLHLNEDWQLVGFYAYDTTKAERYHARWDRVTEVFEGTYSGNLNDKNDTLGLNLTGKIGTQWKLGGNVLWTKARASYDESWNPSGMGDSNRYPTSGGVTAVPLPSIKTELTRFGAFADYAVQKNANLRLDVIYERWNTNTWAYSFANGNPFTFGTTGATADGTFFTQQTPQSTTYVGLRYKYNLD